MGGEPDDLSDEDATEEARNHREAELAGLAFEAGRVFTPGSPLNERELFSGRADQVSKIIDAISQRGYHAVLYGERGVGKTSLSNVLVEYLDDAGVTLLMARINCDGGDDYTSLWRKILKDVEVTTKQPGLGFAAAERTLSTSVADSLPQPASPDDVRRIVDQLAVGCPIVFIFDEFDRLRTPKTTELMADTIKTLSDHGLDATILIIGVADSVDGLIREHHSIERALVQVHLPRMSEEEVEQIVRKGLRRLTMTIDDAALAEIATLSQGLPYVTHLLSLHSARAALDGGSKAVQLADVQEGAKKALGQWQQSVSSIYYSAVLSHQPGNIFKEVLTACALAEPDELGFFKAAAVRPPLRIISGKDYDIPSFARHLNEFTKPTRGPILERTGEQRRVRYRFLSPLMRPYVTMRAFADRILDREKMAEIAQARRLK